MVRLERSLWVGGVGAAFLWAGAGFAQDTNTVIGPPQLRDFSLPVQERIVNQPQPAAEQAPVRVAPPPPVYAPPQMELAYSLPTPQEIVIETETPPQITGTAITSPGPVTTAAAPMVESVEYLRVAAPVYPRESQRRREHGTVLLRVLVDAQGRPAQIQVERSSGFDRLDVAAREAVEKFLFRPYEVNGVPQPAQVLIPIGFDRHAS